MNIDKKATLSALAAAVAAEDLSAARTIMVDYQAKLDTAALEACAAGDAQELNRWLNEGAEPRATTSGQPTAGMLAAKAGSRDCLELLEASGFDFHAELGNSAEGTAACLAAQHGHVEALQFLIERGLATKEKETSPVFDAARHGQAACLQALLAAMLGRDEDGPVGAAALGNHVACLQTLHRHGFNMDFDDGSGETPLFQAANAGSAASIDFLTTLNVNLCPKDPFGTTAVHAAANAGHTEALEALERAGADLREADDQGRDFAHYAVAGGKANVLTWAIAKNLDVNVLDNAGDSPAHCAAKNGKIECLAVLLDAGSDPELKNTQGKTVLETARKWNKAEVVHFFEARAAHAAINTALSRARSANNHGG